MKRKICGVDDPGPGWILVPGSEVVSDTKQSNKTTHETHEEKTDTEITEEIGGLTREEICRALRQKETAASKVKDSLSDLGGRVPQSTFSHKVVDFEEVDQIADIRDGRANSQTRRSSHREEYRDGDKEPYHAELDDYRSNITDTQATPTLVTSRINSTGNVVRITSPSLIVHLSSPESTWSEPRGREAAVLGAENHAQHKTFHWVENHFRGQEPGRTSDHSPVTDTESNWRHPHYTKRQQIPFNTSVPSPPPPWTEMPRRSAKTNGYPLHSPGTTRTPRTQYYLGDDPIDDNRFTGVLSSLHSNDNCRDSKSLSRHSKPKSEPIGVKFATIEHDTYEGSEPISNKNGIHQSEAASPSIVDIIHSLRSKAFLEKENSAISIRDDDSVFEYSSAVDRQVPSPIRKTAKRHVIKIAIKSDESDGSSSIGSPRYVTTPTHSTSSFEYHNKATPPLKGGIVKNAINNLLRNQTSSTSFHPSLPLRSGTNNLQWNNHLAASSPNIHKVDFEPARSTVVPKGLSSGSRSRSIGNLSHPADDDGFDYVRNDSCSPIEKDVRMTKTLGRDRPQPDHFLQKFLGVRDDQRSMERIYAPRYSPKYTHRIELPSPVLPCHSSPSPSSPSPRPLSSPRFYNHSARTAIEPRHQKSQHFLARSPLPSPVFIRRPPSPVLPKPSSLGDDSSSNASVHSHSTNTGSDVTPPGERVETTSRRRVTMTTTTQHEIELPPTDYYYDSVTDGHNMPHSKNYSIVHVSD